MNTRHPWRRRFAELPKHGGIWLILGLELVPAYMMLQIGLKDNAAFFEKPWIPLPPSQWRWDNYAHAWDLLIPYVANTIVVCTLGTVGGLALALGAAYYFARQASPLRHVIWAAFVVLLLMPSIINLVPLFAQLREMNLLNTLTALILVGMAGMQAFCVYVLRGFVEDIPRELFEAAEMDGASHIQQVRHIALPMALPILGTLAIVQCLTLWNDFLLPLLISRDRDVFTVGVGLIYLEGEYVKRWGQIMAAFVMASLPLLALFAFTMRWFIRGMATGAIKG